MKIHCKHSVKYKITYYDPIPLYKLDGTYYLNAISDSIKFNEYSYDELNEEMKKEADEKQLNNSWMQCKEHCKKD